MTNSVVERGVVNTFDAFKGFGFIRREEGKDVFVFYLDVLDAEQVLIAGDEVEFYVVTTPKGPKAEKVRRVS